MVVVVAMVAAVVVVAVVVYHRAAKGPIQPLETHDSITSMPEERGWRKSLPSQVSVREGRKNIDR